MLIENETATLKIIMINMEEVYDIFEYTFIDKKSGLEMVIWSRTDEVAYQIAKINSMNSAFVWTPKKRNFKVLTATNRPPYELEQEQIEQSTKKMEHRKMKGVK